MAPYLHILLESAWVASIIPLGNDATYFAMKAFGGYNMGLALLMATLGATMGQSFNWFAGKLLRAHVPKLPSDLQAPLVFAILMSFLGILFIIADVEIYGHSNRPVLLATAVAVEWYALFTLWQKYRADVRFYVKWFPLLRRFGIFSLLFSWAPLCNLFPAIAGYAGTPWRRALPLILLGTAAHYGWYLI